MDRPGEAIRVCVKITCADCTRTVWAEIGSTTGKEFLRRHLRAEIDPESVHPREFTSINWRDCTIGVATDPTRSET